MLYDRLKILFIILLTVPLYGILYAQQLDTIAMADSVRQDIPQFVVPDSLFVADSLLTDSTATSQAVGSDIQAEVKYTATDSLVFALDGGTVELYGDASISYEDITLEANYIRYEMDMNLVVANGLPDTSGTIQGNPKFADANNSFESKKLKYNFKTQKGYIEEVVSEQEGGYLHAQETMKQTNGHVHLKNGKYTTCDAAHPHFYIAITKGISMPNDKIVSGPAYIVLADVPLPIGIPFGFGA